MELSKIGQSIKQYRKRAGLTQPELAERIGKTESSIRKYEKGLVQIPIDVVDKIAAVLDVPLIRLMPDIKWTEYQNTEEAKKIEREAGASEGIVSLLVDMYGYAELKEVMGESGASGCYYLVGEGEKQFVLYEDDVDNLVSLAKESIKPLVERIKDTRTEDDVVKEILARLDSQETKDWIKKVEADWQRQEKPPE